MGKYDDAMYQYLDDNERFAELFNVGMFQGECVISADMLSEGSERYVSVQEKGSFPRDVGKSQNHYRDLKKQLKNGEWLAVTAIENQEAVDYTMPFRMMQYDCLEYGRQLKQLRNDKEGQLRSQGKKITAFDTFMSCSDKLKPVYSLCFYHGTEEWTGPTSLKSMMDFTGAQQGWEERFHDYQMTLLCANQVKDAGVFQTGLRQVIEVIPCRKNKKKLKELLKQEEFRHLDRDTARMIAVLTDRPKLSEQLTQQEKEEYDMCQAMDELEQDWFNEGMEMGMERGVRDGIVRSLHNLMQTANLTLDQAMDALLIPEGERVLYGSLA